MNDRVPPPWIDVPDLHRVREWNEVTRKQFRDWLSFLYGLAPVDLLEYQQKYPAPPAFEAAYEIASRRHKTRARVDAWMRQYELIATMWQSTTLK